MTRAEGADGGETEQPAGADLLQDGGADEAAGHGASPIDHEEVAGGGGGQGGDVGQAHVADEQVADGDLGADVDEDADGGADEPGVTPDGVGLGVRASAKAPGRKSCVCCETPVCGLELDEREREGEQTEAERDDEIRHAHGGGLLSTVEQLLDDGENVELVGAEWRLGVAEDELRADERSDEGPDGVECLREVEAAGGGLRRADDRDVGVDRNLHDGHAGGENDQRGEEHVEGGELGGGQESERAERHHEQADDCGLLVAQLVDELAGGVAEDEVGAEEVERDVLHLRVVEDEDRLEMRADDVVEAGEKAEGKEDDGGDRHGARVGAGGRVFGIAGRADVFHVGRPRGGSLIAGMSDGRCGAAGVE